MSYTDDAMPSLLETTTSLYAVRFLDGEVRYGAVFDGSFLAPLFATRTEAQAFVHGYQVRPYSLRGAAEDTGLLSEVIVSDGIGAGTAIATRKHLMSTPGVPLSGPVPEWARKLSC